MDHLVYHVPDEIDMPELSKPARRTLIVEPAHPRFPLTLVFEYDRSLYWLLKYHDRLQLLSDDVPPEIARETLRRVCAGGGAGFDAIPFHPRPHLRLLK